MASAREQTRGSDVLFNDGVQVGERALTEACDPLGLLVDAIEGDHCPDQDGCHARLKPVVEDQKFSK
jgi:hypothetical protein